MRAQEDHEIFDLVSAVEASEGKGTTFYSWLGVPSTASTADIGKAYRKKSMQLQYAILQPYSYSTQQSSSIFTSAQTKILE
jgi:hypothetical protein